jgi:hypothetical protein
MGQSQAMTLFITVLLSFQWSSLSVRPSVRRIWVGCCAWLCVRAMSYPLTPGMCFTVDTAMTDDFSPSSTAVKTQRTYQSWTEGDSLCG